MSTSRVVKKIPIAMEDLALGIGTTQQSRGSNVYTVHRIDAHVATTTTAEVEALDVTKYTRARVYLTTTKFVDYIYDPDATAGLASTGTGKWVLSSNGTSIVRESTEGFPDVGLYNEGTELKFWDTLDAYTLLRSETGELQWVEEGNVGDEVDVTAASHLTLAQAQASDLKVGQYVRLTDRGGSWLVTTDTANGKNIIDIGGKSLTLQFTDYVDAGWLGDVKNDASVAQAAVDLNAVTTKFPAGAYNWSVGTETVSEYGVRVHGDPVYDVVTPFAVIINNKQNRTIDVTGCTFNTLNGGAAFVAYRCKNVEIVKGTYSTTATDAVIDGTQASGIIITRSYKTYATRPTITKQYRGLSIYRCSDCYVDKSECKDSRYFNIYIASGLDVDLSVDDVKNYAFKPVCSGGGFGNYFIDNGVVYYGESYDLNPLDTVVQHYKTELGGYYLYECNVKETATQNAAPIINGIVAVKAGIVGGDAISDIRIIGGNVSGCYKNYWLQGVQDWKVAGITSDKYWQTGVSLVTETGYAVRNGSLSDINVGNLNEGSTRFSVGNDKNAGLQIEENDSVSFQDVFIAANLVEAGRGNVVKLPEYNVYVEATEGGIEFGNNNFIDDAVSNLVPAWVYAGSRSFRVQALYTGTGGSPALLDGQFVYGGGIRLFDSHIELPAAKAGMNLYVTAINSGSVLYATGANNTTNSPTDSFNVTGVGAGTRSITMSTNSGLKLICLVDGQWDVLNSGTAPTVL